jgi:Protein of unknown function (DUF2950)
MRLKSTNASSCKRLLILLVAIPICASSVRAPSQTAGQASTTSPSSQIGFETPQNAAQALIKATATYDPSALLQIFGPDGKELISTADPVQDKNRAEAFAVKAREKEVVTLDPKNNTKAILTVGNNDWPFPLPIVKRGSKWYFDIKQGHDEILYRRIGTNELDAIQVCRGFVEAQKEYALTVHDDSGVNQYAQKIISTPGKRDGLYWQNPDGTPGGPVSEAVARAIQEGYVPGKTTGYHGYYFKVLKGQGPAAPMGELDYVINGIMIGGFALVAFPAEYRVTGVKTFIVSNTGVVYQKDLGPDTVSIAKTMDRYNPDKTWRRTNDQWPENASDAGY